MNSIQELSTLITKLERIHDTVKDEATSDSLLNFIDELKSEYEIQVQQFNQHYSKD